MHCFADQANQISIQQPCQEPLSRFTCTVCEIDRTWHEWQQRNPHATPVDLDAVLAPWGYTIADTLDMSRFGYECVKCAFLVPVGLATPVGRFVSQPINLPDTLRGSFRRRRHAP